MKLSVFLLVKLKGPYQRQRMTTGAFALCAIRLVKLTQGRHYRDDSFNCQHSQKNAFFHSNIFPPFQMLTFGLKIPFTRAIFYSDGHSLCHNEIKTGIKPNS